MSTAIVIHSNDMSSYWDAAEAASAALQIASLTGADEAEIRRLERVLRAAQNALFAAAKKKADAARTASR